MFTFPAFGKKEENLIFMKVSLKDYLVAENN